MRLKMYDFSDLKNDARFIIKSRVDNETDEPLYIVYAIKNVDMKNHRVYFKIGNDETEKCVSSSEFLNLLNWEYKDNAITV